MNLCMANESRTFVTQPQMKSPIVPAKVVFHVASSARFSQNYAIIMPMGNRR